MEVEKDSGSGYGLLNFFIVDMFANSEDPDEMLHITAFQQGLHFNYTKIITILSGRNSSFYINFDR